MAEHKFGTREWAKYNMNIYNGCGNYCRYCYAKSSAKQYGRIKTDIEWKVMHECPLRLTLGGGRSVSTKPRKLDGRIMFPTNHDIMPEHVERTVNLLTPWLETCNELLIVSKPTLNATKELCDRLQKFKSQIIFRFTIGTGNSEISAFWDTGAPLPVERIDALRYAFDKGWQTSVSCEPYLNYDITHLVGVLSAWVTNTIWVGKMNFVAQRVDTKGWTLRERRYLNIIEEINKIEYVRKIYQELRNNPKVMWKESIKKVLGLPADENYG